MKVLERALIVVVLHLGDGLVILLCLLVVSQWVGWPVLRHLRLSLNVALSLQDPVHPLDEVCSLADGRASVARLVRYGLHLLSHLLVGLAVGDRVDGCVADVHGLLELLLAAVAQ